MSCCCPEARSAGKFFSLFARNYRKRYAKKGFETSQKLLVEGLRQAGFQNASLLEIGSGVGYLHQTLIEDGAASAVGIDLSHRMITEAEAGAAEKGLSDRIRYILDDFVSMEEVLEPVDITILDKVICCYPDADGLVHKSLERTRRVYALIYPRDRWFMRAGSRFMAGVFFLLRVQFRSYIHDPKMIEAWITNAGFGKKYENQTIAWLTQVYVRA
ncbi:MAG: class I SAM-dependent methyltransferase [Acidiferrobacterales bacterium]